MIKIIWNLVLVAVAYYSTIMGATWVVPTEIFGLHIDSVTHYQFVMLGAAIATQMVLLVSLFVSDLIFHDRYESFEDYVYGFTFVLVSITLGAFLFGTVIQEIQGDLLTWVKSNPKTLYVLLYFPIVAWIYNSIKKACYMLPD